MYRGVGYYSAYVVEYASGNLPIPPELNGGKINGRQKNAKHGSSKL